MKILVTGITTLHCEEDYYLRQQLKVVPSEQALVRLLREMGHFVEQRAVKWGEDLDGYDRIITYLCGTDSFVCGHTSGALWTLKRKDTLIAFDDYQVDRTVQDGTFKPDAKWKDAFVNQMEGATNRDELDELHFDWCKDRQVLIPAFSNGNLDLLFAKTRKKHGDWLATQNITLHGYDPNPFLEGRVPRGRAAALAAVSRRKQWVVAGLSKQNRGAMKKWKPTFPVIELGGRGENGIRMPEPEAVEWFGESWLHCMPGYSHAGSGWWRSRPSQLAGHGVVCYCDPKEGAIYGDSWVIQDPLSLEAMSEAELESLGAAQAKEFFERHPIDDSGKLLSEIAMQVFLESV